MVRSVGWIEQGFLVLGVVNCERPPFEHDEGRTQKRVLCVCGLNVSRGGCGRCCWWGGEDEAHGPRGHVLHRHRIRHQGQAAIGVDHEKSIVGIVVQVEASVDVLDNSPEARSICGAGEHGLARR